MKHVSFIAGPKNGGFVTSQFAKMHHSAETRLGWFEAAFAVAVIAAVVGFAVFIAG